MIFDTWLGEIFGRPRLIEKRQYKIDIDPQARAAAAQPQEINPQARWAIGLTGADHKPYAILHCVCKCDTTFELPGNGKAPKPNCCINAPAYPQDEFHQKHLWLTGTGAVGDAGRFEKRLPGVVPEPTGAGPHQAPNTSDYNDNERISDNARTL